MDTEFNIKMRYRFYATLDERTCPVCGELDLQDFDPADAKEGENKPPMHPNCRCVIQPAMDGETKEEIVRRGRDEGGKGKVMPAGMSYKEWKEQYANKTLSESTVSMQKPLDKSWTQLYEERMADAEKERLATKVKDEYAGDNTKNVNESSDKPTTTGKYDTALNTDDLVRIAKENGIELKNADKADFMLMKGSLNNLDKMMKDNPVAAKDLKEIIVTGEGLNEETIAKADPVLGKDNQWHTAIKLNERWYSKPDELKDYIDKNVKAEWFVKGTTPENMICHEFGHCAHMSASIRFGSLKPGMTEKEIDRVVLKDAEKMIDDYFDKAGPKGALNRRLKISTDISYYAANKDAQETIAEAFNDVHANGRGASKLSRAIYNTVKRILKDNDRGTI